MSVLTRGAMLAAALSLSTALTSFGIQAEEVTVTDILDREVTVNLPAERVVLGFYFEDYMAIGGEAAFDSVVGISREAWEGWIPANWSMHLAHRPSLDAIEDVGEVEVQTFSIEKVLSLDPDLVILAEWQYLALGFDVDRIEAEGIPVVVIDYNAQTLERHVESTEILGTLTGQPERAEEIADLYSTALTDVSDRIAALGVAKPKVYVEFGNKGPAEYSFTYGKNMWGAMATAAGGDNIAAPFVEWWGPINPEQVLASAPDAIFISGREFNANETALAMGVDVQADQARSLLTAFKSREGWDQLPAVQNGKVYGVYQGASRTLSDFAMVQFMAKQLYPTAFEDIDPIANYHNYYQTYLPVDPQGTFAIAAGE